MSTEMKWYIFDEDNHPLCWVENDEAPACEFDTEADAIAFKGGCLNLPDASDLGEMKIKNCILFYDGDKRNMSGLIPVANGDDVELKKWSVI
jgi:hypothetical protein